MEEKYWHIDIGELRALWLQGLHIKEIADRLQTTRQVVYSLKDKHKLPARPRVCVEHLADPTPEEIEERKAEIKARHMEAMRSRIGWRPNS
jgi:transposase